MFKSQDTILQSYIMIGEDRKSGHFFIYKVGQLQMMCNLLYAPIDYVMFEFSNIITLGETDDNKSLIGRKALHLILLACDLKKGSFLFLTKLHTNKI